RRSLPWVVVLGVGLSTASYAQESAPTQEPFGPSTPSSPALPNSAVPPSAGVVGNLSREEQPGERTRQLEDMGKSPSNQVNQMSTRPAAGAATTGGVAGTGGPDVGSPATAVAPSAMGAAGAPGQSLPPNPPPSARFDSPATLENKPSNVKFGPGFEIR